MAGIASLGRGVKVFLAIDAVLVIGLIVAAVLVLSGGIDDTAGDGGPTDVGAGTSASPGSGVSDGATDGATDRSTDATSIEAQSFASPTGNISCTMSVDGVTCSIARITFAPPAVEGCTGSTGHVIVLNTSDGVTTPCVEGPDPAVASADTLVLEYGRTQTVGPYTCTSASNGMSCVVDETGAGFRVATAELATLP